MLQAIIQTDVNLFILLNAIRHPVMDWFFWLVSQLGNYWVAVPAVAGGVLIMSSRKNILYKALFVLFVLTVNGIITAQIKLHVNRPRPVQYFCTTSGIPKQLGMPLKIFPPEERLDSISGSLAGEGLKYQSFPSGHTSTAFACATTLILLLGMKYWAAFAVAFLVAYSRIYLGLHFPLDLIGGIVVGVLTSLALYGVCRKAMEE